MQRTAISFQQYFDLINVLLMILKQSRNVDAKLNSPNEKLIQKVLTLQVSCRHDWPSRRQRRSQLSICCFGPLSRCLREKQHGSRPRHPHSTSPHEIHSNGTRSKTKEQSNSSNAAAVQQKNVRMESAGKPNRRDAKIQGRKMTMQMKASEEHGDAREVLQLLALHQGNPEMHQSP